MSETGYTKSLVITGLVVGAVATAWILWHKQSKRKLTVVGKVSAVYLYPVKSCGLIELSSGRCTRMGLRSGPLKDRYWMIVDSDDKFVTIGHEPRMCLIQPSLSADEKYVHLDVTNMPTLKLPIDASEIPISELEIIKTRVWRHDVTGRYCGKEAEAWLTTFFDKANYKLLVLDDLPPVLCSEDPKYSKFAQREDIIAYQNNSPYLITGEGSLTDLNQRLENPVTMKNFRPNLVVSGTQAFEEDKWKYLQIGDACFRRFKYCQRCKITTVDPETGIRHTSEPMETLKSYRLCNDENPDKSIYGQSPLFGVNMAIVKEGTVRVGDMVYASYDD